MAKGIQRTAAPPAVKSRATRQVETIRISNISNQTISLQVRPPDGDFFLHEQQVHIMSGKEVTLPKDHTLMDQIMNLQARRMLKITHDSEAPEQT